MRLVSSCQPTSSANCTVSTPIHLRFRSERPCRPKRVVEASKRSRKPHFRAFLHDAGICCRGVQSNLPCGNDRPAPTPKASTGYLTPTQLHRKENPLATLFWAAVLAIGCWIYKSGKRVGSRKGYNVGVSRGRRRRR